MKLRELKVHFRAGSLKHLHIERAVMIFAFNVVYELKDGTCGLIHTTRGDVKNYVTMNAALYDIETLGLKIYPLQIC